MTTGERLVDISTLTSDTALNHFLNISVGGGQTIYRDRPLAIEVHEVDSVSVYANPIERAVIVAQSIEEVSVKVNPIDKAVVSVNEIDDLTINI